MPDDLTYRIKIDKDEALRDIREIRDEIRKAITGTGGISGAQGSSTGSTSSTSGVAGASAGRSGPGLFGNSMKLLAAFKLLQGPAQVGNTAIDVAVQAAANYFAGGRGALQAFTRPLRAQNQTIAQLGIAGGDIDPADIRAINDLNSQIIGMQDKTIDSVITATGGFEGFQKGFAKNLMNDKKAQEFFTPLFDALNKIDNLIQRTQGLLDKFGF